jgi:hypothetical protein
MKRLAWRWQYDGKRSVMPGISRKIAAPVWSATPTRAGSRPRFRSPGVLAFAVCVALSAGACAPDSAHQVTAPIDLGMTNKLTTPYYSDQNLTLYQVQTPVPLPVRRPTDAEISALGGAPQGTPYPRAPFLLAADESVEVHYTISNLDADQQTVWMLVDPWNEFVRYSPGVQVVSDEETTPNFGYDLAFVVPGMSRVQGTLTSDDMHEIAIKLAAVMKLLASPQAQAGPNNNNGFDATVVANNIFNPQNRSNSNDPLYTPWIPPVIAGLTGFDLGLRYRCGDANCKPPDVAIEITMDVQDLRGNRFVPQDSTQTEIGVPGTVLSPPAAR